MHWKVFTKPDSKYIGEADFSPLTETKLVTIKTCTLEEIQSQSGLSNKGILHFVEPVKPLAVNVGNGKKLMKLFGKETDGWTGKQIVLWFDQSVMFGREKVGGVRIKEATGQAKAVVGTACADCGATIAAAGGYSAQAIISSSTAKYQTALCLSCAMKRKEATVQAAEEVSE